MKFPTFEENLTPDGRILKLFLKPHDSNTWSEPADNLIQFNGTQNFNQQPRTDQG